MRFHRAASAEVGATVEWYEAHHPGLGRAFLDELDRGLTAISEAPDRWTTWPGVTDRLRIRRFLLARFPYGIAYRTDNDEVVVMAVAHLRRRPGYWKSRAR